MELAAAISLGLLGSFHCVGMCGPIALALPVGTKSNAGKFFSILLYNAGRICTYALFGLLFGITGKGIVLAGFQQILSIILGLVILLFLAIPGLLHRQSTFFYGWLMHSKSYFANQFRRKESHTFFLIGLLNGLLPCGLVYLAVAGAIATSDSLKGAMFMAAFGAGTLPVMLFIAWSKNWISISARNAIRKVSPVLVTAMAVLFVLRGLNLGIPYISPSLDTKEKTLSCCAANSCKK